MPVTPRSLRNAADFMQNASGVDPVWLREAAIEIEQLHQAIVRIDAINDSPSCFNPEINQVCDAILRPHLSPSLSSKDGQ